MKRLSIAVRLTCWFSGVFLAGFVVFGIVMWLDLAWHLAEGRDRTLVRRATRLDDLLQATEDQPAAVRDERYAKFAEGTPEGYLIHLYNKDGRRLYPANVYPADFPWPPLAHSSSDVYRNVEFRGRPFRVLTHQIVLSGQTMTIAVGGQLEDNRSLLSRFATGLKAATPVLLIVSALCGYLLSRRALGPVDELTAAVRSISIGNLSRRLPIHNTGDELHRLAETSNEMLARLESAVSLINRFTADASHELRTPLSFIRTVSEFALQNPGMDAESRQGFEDILAESLEAGRLLEDMLTLARADAGRLDVTLGPLNVTELVRNICDKARPVAVERQQELILRTPEAAGAAEVQGDRSSLWRLFWSLIDNAVKYTPQGGRIEVTVDQSVEEVRVSVRDSGIGIPQESLPHVFERFFRTDGARNHAEGTGLGLAIAKWIADAHHASLLAESKLGAGTVFTVVFRNAS